MIDFVVEAEQCAICGSALQTIKTSSRLRPVMSLQAGAFIPREVLKQCAKDSTHPVVHSEALVRIVKPRQQIAYDVIVQVGLARYLRDMRREEIRDELQQERCIELSEGSISNACDRFLHYLEALHSDNAANPTLSVTIISWRRWGENCLTSCTKICATC